MQQARAGDSGAEVFASGIPLRPRNDAVTGFLSLVTARMAASLRFSPHIRME
jgi:hypothetical protein